MIRTGLTWVLLLGIVTGCKPSMTEDFTALGAPTGQFIDLNFDDELEELEPMSISTSTMDCSKLVRLEPAALLGKLTDDQIRCLDANLREAKRQTQKNKISRLLMADAWARGDKHRWEAVVERHLLEIDRSDPDLCYRYAVHLSKKGPERTDLTMRWADVALDNKSKWSGGQHVSRVYNLHKVKTKSAMDKWSWLENEYLAEPSLELSEELEETRNMAKTLAREWLEYARQSGRDQTLALQMCVSSAGSVAFCE
jgi:hypothetical protein